MSKTAQRRCGTVLAAALVSVALVLTGCGSNSDSSGSSPSAEQTRVVKSDDGNVRVPAAPQRVVVLHPAQVLTYLDFGGKPVGVSPVDDSIVADLPAEQQAAYKAATVVASSSGEVDLEKIATLKPDVIVTLDGDSDWQKKKAKFNSIAPTVFLGLQSASDFQFTALAEATNTVDALKARKATFDAKVSELQQKYGAVLKKTKIVETYRGDWSKPAEFSLNGSLCAEMVRDEKVFDLGEPKSPVSYEQIPSLAKYDLILYNATVDGKPTTTTADLLNANAWKALPAVKAGHAQPVYCPWAKTYGITLQYLDGVEKALAKLSTQ